MGTLSELLLLDDTSDSIKKTIVAFAEDQIYALRVPRADVQSLPAYFLPNLVTSTAIAGELDPSFESRCFKLPVAAVLPGSDLGLLAQALFEAASVINSARSIVVQEVSLSAVVQSGMVICTCLRDRLGSLTWLSKIMLKRKGNFDLPAFLHIVEEAVILATVRISFVAVSSLITLALRLDAESTTRRIRSTMDSSFRSERCETRFGSTEAAKSRLRRRVLNSF